MIAKDQPTIFNDEPVHVVVSDKSDGNMSFRSGHDTEKTADHIKAFVTGNGMRPEDVAGIRIEYEDRKYDHILEFAELREKNDLTDYATWVVTDAIVLTKPGTAAFLPIADCNGVAMYDPVHNVLALAHIGWHASADDLPKNLVDYFVEHHETKPQDLKIYITPSIRKESYLVQQPAQVRNPAWENYLRPAKTGYWVDLLGFITDQLKASSVKPENIEVCQTDTALSDDYFSHYMALQELDTTGRFAVMATLQ